MGLNLVIGCHQCRQKVWFYRGEIGGMEAFYRAHWPHSERIELTDDQADRGWLDRYLDVGGSYGVEHPEPDAAQGTARNQHTPVRTRTGAQQ